MLEKCLDEFLETPISSQTRKLIACIKEEPENFQHLIKNRDFINKMGVYKFPIILMALQADSTNFQAIVKIPDLKLVILKSDKSNKIFLSVFVLRGESAYDNLVAILNDIELKECLSQIMGPCLVLVTKNHPAGIQGIITHSDFKEYMSEVIIEILSNSQNKKDADLAFADIETFGTWSELVQTDVYNKIAKNYRAALPESLFKHCLFAVKEEQVLANECVPEELKEAVRNFSIN